MPVPLNRALSNPALVVLLCRVLLLGGFWPGFGSAEGAAQPVHFTDPDLLPSGEFQAVLHGAPGLLYVMEASTDLRDWIPVQEVTLDDSGLRILKHATDPGDRTRFFRARLASAAGGRLSGVVWFDADGDGQRGPNELGLPGWTVFVDEDDDEVVDPTEQWALTTADGNYALRELAAGSYAVRARTSDGWTSTAPAAGVHRVTLSAGTALGGIDFGRHWPGRLWWVNSTADPGDGVPDAAELTLREAIVAANATVNQGPPDRIVFGIPANDPGHVYYRDDGVAGQLSLGGVSGTDVADDAQLSGPDPDWPRSWYTIALASGLPAVTDALVIDGSTQPGYADSPVIELNGTRATSSSGLILEAGGCTIRGLAVNRFLSAHGIVIQGPGGNAIEATYLGTDVAGMSDHLNGLYGIFVNGSPNNRLGGTSPAERNLVSRNVAGGIVLSGGGAAGNRLHGNYIGTDSRGTSALPNTAVGVLLLDAPQNLIGGPGPGEGNLISGNGGPGLYLQGAGALSNRVQGNFIGTDVRGVSRLANSGGIRITHAPRNLIGGTVPGAGNLISANRNYGVDVSGS